MKGKKALLSVFVICLIVGQGASQSDIQQGKLAIYKKRYVNYPFGYQFKIPNGFIGTCSPAPMPQHGLTIDLSGNKNNSRRLVSFAYFDAAALGSLEQVVNDKLKELRPDKVKKQRIRQGQLRGVQLKYKLDNDPIEQWLFYRREKDVAVIYDVYLRTKQAYYRQDKRIFQQMMVTWQFSPLS